MLFFRHRCKGLSGNKHLNSHLLKSLSHRVGQIGIGDNQVHLVHVGNLAEAPAAKLGGVGKHNGLMIHWENIEGFGKWNGGVLVFTNNVEERLAAANLIKRWNMKLSIKMSKTDILAPELGFEGSCNDFIAQCEEELIKFKNK